MEPRWAVLLLPCPSRTYRTIVSRFINLLLYSMLPMTDLLRCSGLQNGWPLLPCLITSIFYHFPSSTRANRLVLFLSFKARSLGTRARSTFVFLWRKNRSKHSGEGGAEMPRLHGRIVQLWHGSAWRYLPIDLPHSPIRQNIFGLQLILCVSNILAALKSPAHNLALHASSECMHL